jgi:hypothetical protein
MKSVGVPVIVRHAGAGHRRRPDRDARRQAMMPRLEAVGASTEATVCAPQVAGPSRWRQGSNGGASRRRPAGGADAGRCVDGRPRSVAAADATHIAKRNAK